MADNNVSLIPVTRYYMTIDLDKLSARKAELDHARAELKAHFIGIDQIIDDLLEYVHIWYLMPEILTRPIIVNLWGMTGVGKTDLIRRLVSLLDFQERFVEVELTTINSDNWENSVLTTLENSRINDNRPAIVLFDEIQRFRTLDSDGEPLEKVRATDFWELLSDGRLVRRQHEDLDYSISSLMMSRKRRNRKKAKPDEKSEDDEDTEWGTNTTTNFWEAQRFKKMLGSDKPLHEIAEISPDQMLDMLIEAKLTKKVYEPIDHSQTLIFISGNLDDAFTMAGQTSEADIDADIFYSFTKNVTMVNIKDALSKRYRPEEVARFGNIHLIYRGLSRHNYETLITREISRIIAQNAARFGLTLTISPAINVLIYQNGVFPAQGVRPVFSSIIDILESHLSKFVFTALTTGQTSIALDYDPVAQCLNATVGSDHIRIPYVGRIDRIRQTNERDLTACISVHESGHAVAYMALFGLAPLQLKSKIAHSSAGGFTFPHTIYDNRQNMLRQIQVYLAGGLAEELVFSRDRASTGREADRKQTTHIAADFVRRYGFSDDFQANYALEGAYMMDKRTTDLAIESLIKGLVAETQQLLQTHRPALLALSVALCERGSLEADTVADIGARHGLPVLVQRKGFDVIEGFADLLAGQISAEDE